MSFEIDKELDENLMIMQKRRHNHYWLVKTFNVQGEGGSRCHNKALDKYNCKNPIAAPYSTRPD